MAWLDRIPLWALVAVAVCMLPQPHVLEKLLLLKEGSLTRPLDIVDWVMHLTPGVLLGIPLIRKRR